MGMGKRLRHAVVIGTMVLASCAGLAAGADRTEAAELQKQQVEKMFQRNHEKGELNIQFNRLLTKAEREAIYAKYQLTEETVLQDGLFVNVSVESNQQLPTIAARLMEEADIKKAEPNYRLKSLVKPRDSYYNRQWFHSKINAPKAWDRTRGSSQVTVAVIDGGVDTRHPEFKNRLVKPYNVVTGGTSLYPDDHGTHVAGVIGAAMNGAGVTGVAPEVKIMPINIFDGEYANSFDIAEAIIYAADEGADVMNLSFGGYSYSSVEEYAVNYAASKGSILVAAAGNEDTSLLCYPAAFSNVIAVSATDSTDTITGFSNYGRYINISAPGEDIFSTVGGSSYGYASGTSMAAPVVSGAAALILSKNPFLTPQQVMRTLYSSSADLGTKSWDVFYGNGRVDAYRALTMTPEPLGAISLNTNDFKMTGSNNVRAGLTVKGSMRGTVYVEDARGKNVRTLISGALPQKGGFIAYWNGKLANGSFAPAGQYSIVFRVSDNRQSLSKKAAVKVSHHMPPAVKAETASLSLPAGQQMANVKFTINKSLFITAAVYNDQDKLVKTLLTKKALPARSHILSWDGTNGNLKKMPTGTYKLVITGTDLQNKQAKETVFITLT
ncbi:S8 family serine peptidase [Bacillus sp. B190/17]|uniref:S8 family serine peptidase n=1 Tax=Bacillus lumedeiriae TaxID=3058829 RepID=A0ABW8IA66_9BACI